MRAQPRRDTREEIAVRSELHRKGLRFRLHVRLIAGSTRSVDIVLPASRICVDIRGCWWHGCRNTSRPPKTNVEWWSAKIDARIARETLKRSRCLRPPAGSQWSYGRTRGPASRGGPHRGGHDVPGDRAGRPPWPMSSRQPGRTSARAHRTAGTSVDPTGTTAARSGRSTPSIRRRRRKAAAGLAVGSLSARPRSLASDRWTAACES